MRELIQQLMEVDVFKPATEKEVGQRKAAAIVARAARRKELEKSGKKIDRCPKCGADLRDENTGVYAEGWETYTEGLSYDEDTGEWGWGDRNYSDSETTAYKCGKCDTQLTRGKDFDLDNTL